MLTLDPSKPGGPAGPCSTCALGRRGVRVLHAWNHEEAGHRLPDAARGEAALDHALDLPGWGRRARSRLAATGTCRAAMTGFYDLTGWPTAPGRAFRRYTDYIAPALQRRRDLARARAPAPHRRGAAHRPVAGGAALHFSRPRSRLHGGRRGGDARRQPRPPSRRRTASTRARARPLGGDRRRATTRTASALHGARRARACRGRALATAARVSRPATRSMRSGETSPRRSRWRRSSAGSTPRACRRAASTTARGRALPAARASWPLPAGGAPDAGSGDGRGPALPLSRTPAEVTGPAPSFGDSTSGARDGARLRRRAHRRARHRRRAGVDRGSYTRVAVIRRTLALRRWS